MIIDAHCHAWTRWPYEPPVPDPESRALVEQLLFEMDTHGVDRAVIVSARIAHNPDNNDYGAACVRRYPDRLSQFVDVDSFWSPTYHAPGAAARLSAAIRACGAAGFTHYIHDGDDGSWFGSAEGLAFFGQAVELRAIASLALPARLQPALRELARRFPTVPILCHHLAGARVGAPPAELAGILASAREPNIHVKFSGFHYASAVPSGYPYASAVPSGYPYASAVPSGYPYASAVPSGYPYDDCTAIVRALYEHFGPERLHWGSDYPVVRRAATYEQALEMARSHFAFIDAASRQRILGDSLGDLLAGVVRALSAEPEGTVEVAGRSYGCYGALASSGAASDVGGG